MKVKKSQHDFSTLVRSTYGYLRNSGLRSSLSSAYCLWNNLGNSYRNIIFHSNFRKMLQNDFIKENSSLEYFKISKTF